MSNAASTDTQTVQLMTEAELRAASGEIHIGDRIEGAYASYLAAGMSLGLARTAVPELRSLAAAHHGPLAQALEHLAVSLMQKAVLDAAALYDQTGAGATSLANALDLVTALVKTSQISALPDRKAAQKLVDDVRTSVITQKTSEWTNIRYWRNKWAGHRTVDPQVDPWAWEHPVDVGTIERGLDQMRAALNEFAALLTQLPELASLQNEARRVGEDTWRMGLSLEGVSNWSTGAVLSIGDAQGRALVESYFAPQRKG